MNGTAILSRTFFQLLLLKPSAKSFKNPILPGLLDIAMPHVKISITELPHEKKLNTAIL